MKKIAIALPVALAWALSAPAHAAYIVNTGPATTATDGGTLANLPSVVQSLAASFETGQAYELGSTEIWAASSTGATLTLQLVAGADPGGSDVLGTASAFVVGGAGGGWVSFDTSGWHLEAGDYTLVLKAARGSSAYLNGDDIANPLDSYWFAGRNGKWIADTEAFAVRIDALSAAVPEPASYGLMFGGLALVGGLAVRRKARLAGPASALDA